jgi:hypothetical protein
VENYRNKRLPIPLGVCYSTVLAYPVAGHPVERLLHFRAGCTWHYLMISSSHAANPRCFGSTLPFCVSRLSAC